MPEIVFWCINFFTNSKYCAIDRPISSLQKKEKLSEKVNKSKVSLSWPEFKPSFSFFHIPHLAALLSKEFLVCQGNIVK